MAIDSNERMRFPIENIAIKKTNPTLPNIAYTLQSTPLLLNTFSRILFIQFLLVLNELMRQNAVQVIGIFVFGTVCIGK